MSERTQPLAFDNVWKQLSMGIEHIYQLQPMTNPSFMKLYT
jgi:hypothetical protein